MDVHVAVATLQARCGKWTCYPEVVQSSIEWTPPELRQEVLSGADGMNREGFFPFPLLRSASHLHPCDLGGQQ